MPTVLLVDDHPVVRAGIRALLESVTGCCNVVGEAGDTDAGLMLIHDRRPDIAILDIAMPHKGGAHLLDQIIATGMPTRTLIMSFQDDGNFARTLLERGAWGYILKRSASQDLIRAVQIVAEGGKYIDPALAGVMFKRPADAAIDVECSPLSVRELEILRMVATGHSNKEIANRLALSIKTVESYRSRACGKLGLHSRTEIMRHGVRCGWLKVSIGVE